jgi:hypothetical protein
MEYILIRGCKMVKKYFSVFFLVTLILSCTVCSKRNDLVNGVKIGTTGIDDDKFIMDFIINWNGKNYVLFGSMDFVPSKTKTIHENFFRLRGKQIGIVNNDPRNKIFVVNGYDSEEWLINYYTYNDSITQTQYLLKEENVEIIPEELEQFR